MLSDMIPFRMAGNLYFVGTYKASSHLIDTGEGLILIDTGYDTTADVIVDSMKILGFDIRDVKYIIHSHGHYDHTGGTAKLVELSGAKTFLHSADIKYVESLENSFVPDFDIHDGDVIRLGNTEILCKETPGHTEGTVSFFFDVEEKGKKYRAAMFGGAGVNQLRKNYLKERNLSYFQRGQFLESIKRLKEENVDIFIGNHSWQNQTREKYERSLTCEENPFIDDTEWVTFLTKCEEGMLKVIHEESRTEFINFAHRGASEYTPENTMLAFNVGIYMGANGIETDVQLTKDGIPVLFHDETLERVTGEAGCIQDYTYDELQAFLVRKNEYVDKILKLEDFLKCFGFRDLTFAIELKQYGTAQIVADLIRKYKLEQKIVITSFRWEELVAMRKYAPELKTGYLTKVADEAVLVKMKEAGVDEICPSSLIVTKENVEYWHSLGLNVRAYGIGTEEIMKRACEAGVDGMTVNFPDKLTEYIKGWNK